MIRFEVSTLGYTLNRAVQMAALPLDVGIEIFYEWGGTTYWIESMKTVMENRTGTFSIHSPFGYCDFTQTESERDLFQFLAEPFEMYHLMNGCHYVVHSNGHVSADLPEEKRADLRKLATERLVKFNEICKREGVSMVVENVPDNGHTLFNHEQFLALFTENKELNCILDTGHAHMEHLDMYEIQKTLGSRLKAYHVHDNGGIVDSHFRFMSGVPGGIDWKKFVDGVMKYTPNATITLEYSESRCKATTQDYITDIDLFLKMAGS